MASDQVLRVRGDLERYVGRVMVAVILGAHANLVAAPTEGGTPIDTSWASSNWIPEVGAPTRTEPEGARPANGAPASRAASQAGVAAVLAFRFKMSTPQPLSIVNAVPYILPLNDGHSPQASPGFVQRAIAKAVKVDLGKTA